MIDPTPPMPTHYGPRLVTLYAVKEIQHAEHQPCCRLSLCSCSFTETGVF